VSAFRDRCTLTISLILLVPLHANDSLSRLQRVVWFLEAHFGEVDPHTSQDTDQDISTLTIHYNDVVAYIDTNSMACFVQRKDGDIDNCLFSGCEMC